MGLLLVDRQTEAFHEFSGRLHRLYAPTGRAADDEVVRVVHDTRIESTVETELLPGQNEATEVEICKKRRNYTALGRSPLAIPGFRRAIEPMLDPLPHRSAQPAFDDRENLPISHPSRYALHQRAVRNGVEVVGEVSVYHLPPPVLSNVEVHATHCHLSIQSRTEPILLRSQIRLKDGTEDHQRGHLHDAVSNCRYAQWSLTTVSLRNPDSKEGSGAILLRRQLLPKVSQPTGQTLALDRREILAISTCRSAVCTASAVGCVEDIHAIDLVPERIEPKAGFRLSFCL